MARPKDPNFKTKEEDIREKLDLDRQSRIEVKEVSVEEVDAQEAFDQFWALNRAAYKQPQEIKDIVWAHLKAIGSDTPELFEKGCQHFGLKK